MRAWTVLRIVAMLGLVINVASAHHPFSVNYDATKFATLTGKVAAVQWTNPQVVLALDVESGDGKTERWMIEGYPPTHCADKAGTRTRSARATGLRYGGGMRATLT